MQVPGGGCRVPRVPVLGEEEVGAGSFPELLSGLGEELQLRAAQNENARRGV